MVVDGAQQLVVGGDGVVGDLGVDELGQMVPGAGELPRAGCLACVGCPVDVHEDEELAGVFPAGVVRQLSSAERVSLIASLDLLGQARNVCRELGQSFHHEGVAIPARQPGQALELASLHETATTVSMPPRSSAATLARNAVFRAAPRSADGGPEALGASPPTAGSGAGAWAVGGDSGLPSRRGLSGVPGDAARAGRPGVLAVHLYRQRGGAGGAWWLLCRRLADLRELLPRGGRWAGDGCVRVVRDLRHGFVPLRGGRLR